MDTQLQRYRLGYVRGFYENTGVAVIELINDIYVGDWVEFLENTQPLFVQEVRELFIENESVPQAKRGDMVGLKTLKEVKLGAEVYKTQKTAVQETRVGAGV